MTYLIATIKGLVLGRTKAVDSDPAYRFFFETSSRDRKKVYHRALKKTQTDQEAIVRISKEKSRA